jgi:hypothetical protein
MCHRELQGAGSHFRAYPAVVTPYVVALVKKLGQDASSLGADRGEIVLCVPCGSVIERQADAYASRRVEPLAERLEALRAAFDALQLRIAKLENAR